MQNEVEVTKEITKYFKFFFNSSSINNLKAIQPMEMLQPFTELEDKTAIKSLKNNKSSGSDKINAEELKHAPEIIHKQIANIFNETAKTGVFPNKLNEEILILLQSLGRKKEKLKI